MSRDRDDPESAGRQVAARSKRGTFLPGASGNPAGRPVGARNRSTVAAIALLDGEAEALTRAAIDLAISGDAQALRLCIERIVPVARERAVGVEMPKLDKVADLPAAVSQVLASVASGDLTPSEGEKLAGLLSVWRQSVELVDLEKRIAAIEEFHK